jgi:hypothetical protein
MLKTKQMPKNTKKKLKKTKIIGGKGNEIAIANFTLRKKLELLSDMSVTALHSDIGLLVKYNINAPLNNIDDETIKGNIKRYIEYKEYYAPVYTNAKTSFIKYALLCLENHDNNSYLLLKRNYKYPGSLKLFEDYQEKISNEVELKNNAEDYYANFEKFVKNLVKNIDKPEEIDDTKFKDYMYDIYSDGIILLTVGNDDSAHNLKQYKKNSTDSDITDITDIANIVNFFKEKKDCLIIKKDIKDALNENYLYDCMLQIINKLARTLQEKLGHEALDRKGTFSKDALEKAVGEAADAAKKAEQEAVAEDGDGDVDEEGEAKKAEGEEPVDGDEEVVAEGDAVGAKAATKAEKEADLLQNVKKLVDIIYNKYKDKDSEDTDEDVNLKINLKITRHTILLKSLKTILLNYLGENKIIKLEDVDDIYKGKILSKEPLFYVNTETAKVISLSNINYNRYIKDACTTERRIKSFQHIINAIYDVENDENVENIKILKRLSSGFKDDNCDDTINKIIIDKTYLLSEADILRTNIDNYILDNNDILTDAGLTSAQIRFRLVPPYYNLIKTLSSDSNYPGKIKELLKKDYNIFKKKYIKYKMISTHLKEL